MKEVGKRLKELHTIVLFMNLRKKLRLLLRQFFIWLHQALRIDSKSGIPLAA